ncbi:DUF4166 domain-containing protein [Rhodoferax sp. TS-BS-61-7]|nr:DUF4166 domain-containing protein [Rhodoferax sp. TS-BS-61-7]PQA78399.1 DUF4166 domain-containing protein [Rhodoferax sp. TS-BS-61-7]
MYRSVMGDAFNRLATPVQQFHSFEGLQEFHGEVQVAEPASVLAKLLAIFLGAPLKASQGPIRFELLAAPSTETWTRFFPSKTMRSTLTKSGNRITERLGASRLTFELMEVAGALEMRLEKLHFLGIPCPSWLMPRVTARETGGVHTLNFHIQASVPVIGMVASYTGYLNIPQEASE